MKRRPHAYTLIECVLALGLVALVLASLVAVLPVGLASQANGGRRVAEARIMQYLQARGHNTTLRAVPELYFNRDGAPLEDITEAAYVARLDSRAHPVVVPGDSARGDPVSSMAPIPPGRLRCVRVSISDHPHSSATDDDLRMTVHSLLLSPALDNS